MRALRRHPTDLDAAIMVVDPAVENAAQIVGEIVDAVREAHGLLAYEKLPAAA